MTEQSILVYKPFLSLNIPDLSLLLIYKLQPPWEVTLPLSQQPTSKNWGRVKPPILKFGGRFNPSPHQRAGGVHTMIM